MRANEPATFARGGDRTLAVPVLAPGELAVLRMPSKDREHSVSNLLLNSTPHTPGGKRARSALDAVGARCAHAANRYTRNTHAGKIGL
jgi:hypothetical protein